MVVANYTEHTETIVIGAGPGGYVAAIRAAQLGQQVTLIEKEATLGGVCLNVGCIPSKALIHAAEVYEEMHTAKTFGITAEKVQLNWEKTQQWKQEQVVDRMTDGISYLMKKHQINVVQGTAYFTGPQTVHIDGPEAVTYEFEHAIVATGSTPIELPAFKWSERVLDSTGGLALAEIPESLVVIGGGYIGSELAGVYSKLGTEVTILEGTEQILGGFDHEMVALVEKDFKKRNAKVITEARATGVTEEGEQVIVHYEHEGQQKSAMADYVLVTVGRRPNTDLGLDVLGVEFEDNGLIRVDEQGRTTLPHIFAIGDIVPGAALAHKASYEGKVAAETIAGQKTAVDYRAMPAVAFTSTELATVGYSEAEAKAEGFDVQVAKFPLAANGRAVSLNQTDGFIRLVTTGEDRVVIGAQIAGPHASDLISELSLAVEGGLNAEDLALTIHPHPTLGEAVMDAAELARGLPIHI